jgi:hypothetical protein
VNRIWDNFTLICQQSTKLTMPLGRFAGQVLKFVPFAGDVYNTFNEFRDQRRAGFSPGAAAARSIPVGAAGAATNVVDPFGLTNVAPEVLRGLAARRRAQVKEGTAKTVYGKPITSGRDPRVMLGMAPGITMGQMFESPEQLEEAARMADYINSEAHARSIVDRVDPQTRGNTFSMDLYERARQLEQYLKGR